MSQTRWGLKVTNRVVVTIFAFAAFSALAQEPAAEDAPTLPDPTRLDSNWWHYIENAKDELPERIALFNAVLKNISASSGAEIADVVVEIDRSLDIYAELKNRKPSLPLDIPVAADSYTLPEVVDLVIRNRDLQLEVQLEREEVGNRDAAIKSARSRLDNMRAAYFELGEQAPSRLEQGLIIIRDRLRMALAQEELRLLRPRLANKERQLESLGNVLNAASNRLVATGEDVETYMQAYERADEKVTRLTDEAAHYRLRSTEVGETPLDRAQARLHRQKLLDFDVNIATAELEKSLARVAVDFTSLSFPGYVGKENIDLRDSLNELRLKLKETDDLRQNWRRAIDGERSAAEAQLSLSQGQDATLAEVHRRRIRQADTTLQSLADLRENLAKGRLVADLAVKRIAHDEGRLASWFVNIKENLGDFWEVTVQLVTGSLFTINETPVTLLGLFRILVILAVAWWLSKLVRHGLDRVAQRREVMNRASLYTVGRLFHYAILTIGIIVGLSSIGLDFTKLTLFVSALGVGLGFGLQAIFSNFVAGLIILFEKSLKVGDFVELESGVTGEVREINIRSTLITTNDNIDILVPNSEFVGGRVINWTLREVFRRLRIPFGVAYGTDKELVKKAGLEAAASVPFTLMSPANRRPQVWLVAFGDSSLNFELVVWLKKEAVSRPGTVQAAYTWALETALSNNGIEIPFPQRDLHLRSGFTQLAPASEKAVAPDESGAADPA